MKKLIAIIIGILTFCSAINSPAQTIDLSNLINNTPNLVGKPITLNGQTFLVQTNADGHFIVSTIGTAGTNAFLVPASPDQAMQVAQQWISGNNPSEVTFYGTNEMEFRVGAGYLQNSGSAVAVFGLEQFMGQNYGLGIGILQGNQNGKSGTAGAYVEGLYRHPIGNVAVVAGIFGGYDNWNNRGFVGPKVGLENRSSAVLSEWLDCDYAWEGQSTSNRGLFIAGGISYAFRDFNVFSAFSKL